MLGYTYQIFCERTSSQSQLHAILDKNNPLTSVALNSGSSFTRVTDLNSELSWLTTTAISRYPVFTASQFFQTQVSTTSTGVITLWVRIIVANAAQQYMFLAHINNAASSDAWATIQMGSAGQVIFTYKLTETVTVRDSSVPVGQWVYLQFLATNDYLTGMVNTKVSEIQHSQANVVISSPMLMQFRPQGTTTACISRLRYFVDDFSVQNQHYNYYSYYYKLAHKRLYNGVHFLIAGLTLDLEILWIHDTTYLHINFADAMDTPVYRTHSAYQSITGPTSCAPQQFYDGIACIQGSKTLYSRGNTRFLQIPAPRVSHSLNAAAWVFIPSLDHAYNHLFTYVSRDKSKYISVGVSQATSYLKVESQSCPAAAEHTNDKFKLKQWVFLEVFLTPSTNPEILTFFNDGSSYEVESCYTAPSDFDVFQLLGYLVPPTYSITTGAAKQLTFIHEQNVRSYYHYRAGLSVSPYENSNVLAHYLLDGTDVTQNGEQIFNQITAQWDPIALDLDSTSAPDTLPKFVPTQITTKQRIQEFPTCLQEQGVYLDHTFKICKQIRGYAPVSKPTTAPLIPLLQDGGRSWTFGLWANLGFTKDQSGTFWVISVYEGFSVKYSIAVNDRYDVMLVESWSTVKLTVSGGLIHAGHWSYLNAVCSQQSLQNQCQIFPNFESNAQVTPYIGLLFPQTGENTFKITNDIEFIQLTHLRAWSTVVGGSLAAAPNELKKGMFSFTSTPSPYLRLFIPFFNGQNIDRIVGSYQTTASDRMYTDYYQYWVASDFDLLPFADASQQCIEVTNAITISTTVSSWLPNGFTLRLWYRFITNPSTATLLSHASNFLIQKHPSANYQITQYFSDSSLPSASLTLPSLVETGEWDIFTYKLNKPGLQIAAKTYSDPSATESYIIPLRTLQWTSSAYPTALTIGDGTSSFCLRQFVLLSYALADSLFQSASFFFQRDLSLSSRGIYFYLSPLQFDGSALRTDLEANQIYFAPPNTLLRSDQLTVLTVLADAASIQLPLVQTNLTTFSILVLYRLGSAAITSSVNILNLNSRLTISFNTNTEITFTDSVSGTPCSISHSFSSGVDKEDWLPLAISYDGTQMRASRLEASTETTCSGYQLTLSGNLDLSQSSTGTSISYAYIYILNKSLLPGELLYMAFRKYSHYYWDSLLVMGYSFVQKNKVNSPALITDISGSYSADFSAKTKLQWDFTRHNNAGNIPAYGVANKELHFCEDGLVWSRGGACYPFTRSLGLKTAINEPFTLAHTGEMSFVVWLKMAAAIEDVTIFNTGSSQLQLLIRVSDSSIALQNSDLSVNLSHVMSTDSWAQVGAYYTTTGVKFFHNSQSNTVSSASALTNLAVTIVSASSVSTGTLYLFLMSFWNAKIDVSTLRQTTTSQIPSRSSCVLYFQFNFMHQQKYLNWVNPTQSIPKQALSQIQSEDTGLSSLSTCDASTVYNGNECISSNRFAGFTSSFSATMSYKSLTVDTSHYSVMFWVQVSTVTPAAATSSAVTLSFGSSSFSFPISSTGSLGFNFNSAQLSQAVNLSSHKWYLTKASIREASLFDLIAFNSNGILIDLKAMQPFAVPSGLTLDSFSLISTLSSGVVRLAQAALYSIPIPNPASIHFSSLQVSLILSGFSNPGSGYPIFLLQFSDTLSTFQQSITGSTLQVDSTSISFVTTTQDQQGDQFLNCIWDGDFYDISSSLCYADTLPSCSVTGSSLCSASNYALLCSAPSLMSEGACVSACPTTAREAQSLCFEGVVSTDATLSLNSDNSFSIKFASPVQPSEYTSFTSTLQVSITGPLQSYDYRVASITPVYSSIQPLNIDEALVKLMIQNTIRDSQVVNLSVTYEASIGSGVFQSMNTELNEQVNPQLQAEVQNVEIAIVGVRVGAQTSTLLVILQVLITDGALKYLWGLVNASQLMALAVLIKFPLPSNAALAFDLLSLANGDFQFLQYLPNVFREKEVIDVDYLERQKPLNSYFEAGGFDSTSFYLLYETKLTLFFYYSGALVLLITLALIIRNQSNWQAETLIISKGCHKRTVSFFNWDFWVRLALQLYFQVMLVVLVAMHSVSLSPYIPQSFRSPSSYKLDFSLTLLSFLAILGFSLFVLLYLILHSNSLVKKKDNWRGKVLTEDLNLTKHKKWAMMFFPIFLGQRLLFALILVCLRNEPIAASVLSMLLFISVSIFLKLKVLVYLILVRPFEEKSINILEIVNKSTTILLFVLITYLSAKGNTLSQRAILDVGYAIIALILADIVINLVVLIVGSISDLLQFCKKVRTTCKWKQKRYKVGEGDSADMDKSDIMRRGSINPTDISSIVGENQLAPSYLFDDSRTKIFKST